MANSKHERGGRNNPDHHFHNLATLDLSNNKDNDPDQHFRTLAGTSVLGRNDKARHAQNRLLRELETDPRYDPVLAVIEEIQGILIQNKRDSVVAEKAARFLNEVLDATSQTTMDVRIKLTPDTVRTVSKIEVNDHTLQSKKDIYRLLGEKYRRTVEKIPPLVRRESEKSARQIEEWGKWHLNLSEVFFSRNPDVYTDPKTRDKIVSILKEEPESRYTQDGKFFTRKYADLSVEEMAQMPYPPSKKDLSRITEYVAVALESKPSALTTSLINHLFFDTTSFRDENGHIEYENKNLFAVLNFWQEQFLCGILFEQPPQTEDQTGRILRGISENMAHSFPVVNMVRWCNHPAECDPIPRDNLLDTVEVHPLAREVLLDRQEHHPEDNGYFSYFDEIGREYLIRKLLPMLERRLERFGVKDKFMPGIDGLRKFFEEYPFSSEHLDTIKTVFLNRLGEGFLSKLEAHSFDIETINEIVWKSLIGKAHFLPTHQGIEIIEFSGDSVPGIMGIESIAINASGPLDSPIININYSIKNSFLTICGTIDKKGNLALRAPVDKEIPGLYFMLKHIALLSLHDLVVQQEKQPRNKRFLPRRATIFEEKPVAAKKNPQPKHYSSFSRSEPGERIQKDKDLIRDVYRITRYKPRVVRVHVPHLPGAYEYERAVAFYNEARENGDKDKISEAEIRLAEARQKIHKPSPGKVETWPLFIERPAKIHDPVKVEEEIYLTTWVVEHPSPKPTEEERHKPAKLFERYYLGSSALNFLNELLPSLTGE